MSPLRCVLSLHRPGVMNEEKQRQLVCRELRKQQMSAKKVEAATLRIIHRD